MDRNFSAVDRCLGVVRWLIIRQGVFGGALDKGALVVSGRVGLLR